MNDSDIIKLCQAIYSDPVPVGWDHYFPSTDRDGICAGIKNNTLIFRGSITPLDWFRDFMISAGGSKDHPQLGPVETGFDEDMDEFFEEASKFLGPGACFGGHSLGAARAWLAAGRYIAQGGRPGRITVCGSPKPGGYPLGQLLAPYPKGSYRNGSDPVPDVPFWIGSGTTAIEPTTPTIIKIEPVDWSEGLMSWHNINLYAQGVCNA